MAIEAQAEAQRWEEEKQMMVTMLKEGRLQSLLVEDYPHMEAESMKYVIPSNLHPT